MSNKDIMEYSFAIIPEQQLVIENIIGTLNLDGILELRQRVRDDGRFDPAYDFILDFRNCFIDIIVGDLQEFIANYDKENKVFDKHKTVFLVSNHNQLAYALGLKAMEEKGQIPRTIKIFTETDSAMDWLEKPLLKNEVKELFKSMVASPQHLYKTESTHSVNY